MLKKLILVAKGLLVALMVAVGLLVATALPSHLEDTQSVVIRAPKDRITPFVTDLRRWQEWSVWSSKYDAQTQNTYERDGATWNWAGSDQRHAKFELGALEPNAIHIEVRGVRLIHTANFTFTQEADGTRVNWETLGMGPLFVVWLSGAVIDRHERDVETSLNNLKTVVEAAN